MNRSAYLDVLSVTRWVPKPKALAVDVWVDTEARNGQDIFLLTESLDPEYAVFVRRMQSGLNQIDSSFRFVLVSLQSDELHPLRFRLKDNDVIISLLASDNKQDEVLANSSLDYFNLDTNIEDIIESGIVKKQTYLKVLEHLVSK